MITTRRTERDLSRPPAERDLHSISKRAEEVAADIGLHVAEVMGSAAYRALGAKTPEARAELDGVLASQLACAGALTAAARALRAPQGAREARFLLLEGAAHSIRIAQLWRREDELLAAARADG